MIIKINGELPSITTVLRLNLSKKFKYSKVFIWLQGDHTIIQTLLKNNLGVDFFIITQLFFSN